MRVLATVLILCLTILAGCADGSGKEETEETEELVEVGGETIAASKGIVTGRVLNDRGLAVQEARVSLLGSDFFADTNITGHYKFVNVSAREFQMSVQADGFLPYKAPVMVVAGEVTVVDVQLAPNTQAGAGYTPHIHDHWGGQSEYLLMDGSLDLTQPNRGDGAYFLPWSGIVRPITNSTDWFIPILDTPHGGPAIVLPGTAMMTITMDSDDATVTQEEWGLKYRHAGQGKVETLGSKTLPATWTIPVNQSMTDSGHQSFSRWELYAYVGDTFTTGDGGFAQGDMDVTITLTKGELYLEPVHEDFWGGQKELVLREEPGFMTGTTGFYAPYSLPLDDEKIVPPGTSRLLLELDWTWASDDNLRTVLPIEFMYRPASMNVQTWTFDDLIRPTPIEGSIESGSALYELELDGADTDAFYQTRTGWAFYIKVQEHPLYHWEVRPGGIEGELSVLAIQD